MTQTKQPPANPGRFNPQQTFAADGSIFASGRLPVGGLKSHDANSQVLSIVPVPATVPEWDVSCGSASLFEQKRSN
jgi:hypothetical protein